MEDMPHKNSPEPKKSKEGKELIDLRILVAEDNLENRELLIKILSKKYTSVETVEDGKLLMEKLLTAGYRTDVIITDNEMPNMTGIEAIREILDKDHLKDIPIILYTTSFDSSPLMKEARELGVVVLQKPAGMNDIYNAIEKARSKPEKLPPEA